MRIVSELMKESRDVRIDVSGRIAFAWFPGVMPEKRVM
jgi:hypothetical protein